MLVYEIKLIAGLDLLKVFRYDNSINCVKVVWGFAGNNVRFRYCDGTFCCEGIVCFATKNEGTKGHEGISLCNFFSLSFVAMMSLHLAQ